MRARLFAGATLLALANPAQADMLLDNVDGVTLDATGAVDHFNGLVIGDDGRVAKVLHRSDKRPRATYLIDGQSKFVMPGMKDALSRACGDTERCHASAPTT